MEDETTGKKGTEIIQHRLSGGGGSGGWLCCRDVEGDSFVVGGKNCLGGGVGMVDKFYVFVLCFFSCSVFWRFILSSFWIRSVLWVRQGWCMSMSVWWCVCVCECVSKKALWAEKKYLVGKKHMFYWCFVCELWQG